MGFNNNLLVFNLFADIYRILTVLDSPHTEKTVRPIEIHFKRKFIKVKCNN